MKKVIIEREEIMPYVNRDGYFIKGSFDFLFITVSVIISENKPHF